MARFRRALNLRPVNSEKHEVSWTFLAQNASAVQQIVLIDALAGEPVAADDVQTGAVVPWMYVEFNLNGVDNSGASQVVHWLIMKDPQNSLAAIVDPATYDQNYKKWILKRGMEMLPEVPLDSGGTVQTKRIFTIRFPKKTFQRMAEGDRIKLFYKSTSASGINFCGFVVFKEFT